jgi:hypothetical protein
LAVAVIFIMSTPYHTMLGPAKVNAIFDDVAHEPPPPFLRHAQGANAPAGFTSSDFEGMQAEALAWGEAGGDGAAGGLSILLPAPGDGLGLFELDCAVRVMM